MAVGSRGEPCRVLLLTHTLGAGGAETSCLVLGNELAGRGHPVCVLCLDHGRPLADRFAPQVQVTRLHRDGLRPGLAGWRAAYAEIREFGPHAMVNYQRVAQLNGPLLGRLAGVPCVVSRFGNTTPASRGTMSKMRAAFGLTHRGVAISQAVRNHCVEHLGLLGGKLEVILSGLPTAQFAADGPAQRAAVRSELGLAPEHLAVVTVAGLRPAKGHEVLVRAAARLAPRLPALRWFLIGEGKLRPSIERAAAEAGLAGRLALLGSRLDVPRLLHAMDLFCLPSAREGFGLATAEAMAAGLPVVGTSVGGNLEVVEDGVTGWLVPPADDAALAAAIERWAALPDRGRELGLAGRQRTEQLFSAARMADQYLDLFRRVLG